MIRRLNLQNRTSLSENRQVNDNWDLFYRKNSPIHNNALSPFFVTSKPGVVDYYKSEYTITDNKLYKNDTELFEVDDRHFERADLGSWDSVSYYNGDIYCANYNDSAINVYKNNGDRLELYRTVPILSTDSKIYFRLVTNGNVLLVFKSSTTCFCQYNDTIFDFLYFNVTNDLIATVSKEINGRHLITFVGNGFNIRARGLFGSSYKWIEIDTDGNLITHNTWQSWNFFVLENTDRLVGLSEGSTTIFEYQITNISTDGGLVDVDVTVTQQLTNDVFSLTNKTSYVDIGYNYFRWTAVYDNNQWTSFHPGTACNFTYDSLSGITKINAGTQIVTNDVNKYPTYLFPNHNPTGSSSSNVNAYNVLINNGYISGVSYNGILLTEWNSIDTATPVIIDNEINDILIYKDVNQNKWYKISIADGAKMSLLYNRLLVINTTSYWNAYDFLLNKKQHIFSDWNNRLFWGLSGVTTDGSNGSFGSGHNVSYNVIGRNEIVADSIFPSLPLYKVNLDTPAIPGIQYQSIDIYTANSLTTPKYTNTYYNNGYYTDKDLSYYNVSYSLYNSTSFQRTPSLFARFITTNTDKDFFIDGFNGYQVTFKNGYQPMILSTRDTAIQNTAGVFVIQSMPFAIYNNKIFSLNYLNGSYQGKDCIIDVEGMVYIGSIPEAAFFYSKNDRCLWIFRGDANLTRFEDASSIDNVYYTTFNPATQSIYFATNNGLFVYNHNTSFRLDYYNVEFISFTEDGKIVIRDSNKSDVLSYEASSSPDETSNKVILDTNLMGAGESKLFSITKYIITLYSKYNKNGIIKCSSYSLLNNGHFDSEAAVKKISKTDWDSNLNTVQVDFSPSKSKGKGIGLILESDFAIQNIDVECHVDKAENVTKINI